ncbi:MAG: restriction endonuclease subunit S, partial [Saprospiraceae bacterium]
MKDGAILSLPKGWEVKKLGEVVEVLDNLRKPITKRDRVEGQYPYYGATGILSFVHNYIFAEKLVLIGEDGAKWASGEKTSFIAEGKYWVNNHAHVIRPMRKIILDEWIVYFLNFSDLTKYITGMTVPKLNQEKMRGIEIPLPSLP